MQVSNSKSSDHDPYLKCSFCRRLRGSVWTLFLSDFDFDRPGTKYVCDICVRAANDFVKNKPFPRIVGACSFCMATKEFVQYMIEGDHGACICSDCITSAKSLLAGIAGTNRVSASYPRPF